MKGLSSGGRARSWPLLVLSLSLLPSLPAVAAPRPLRVESSPFQVDGLVGHADALRDGAGRLDLAAARAADGWVPVQRPRDLNVGYIEGALWLRFVLDNRSDTPRMLRLRLGTPQVDRIDVHVLRAGGRIERHVLGDALPAVDRDTSRPSHTFDLGLAPAERVEVYARAETTSAMSLPLVGRDLFAFGLEQGVVLERTGIVLGVLLALLLYHLAVFLAARETLYFWYALQTAGILLYGLSIEGSVASCFPDAPGFVARAPGLGLGIIGIALVQFIRHLLGLKRGDTRPERLLRALGRLQWLALAVALVANPRLGAQFATVAVLTGLLGAGAVAISELPRQHWSARVVVIAWSVVALCGGWAAISALGGGGDLEARRTAMLGVLVFERIMLALPLATRMRVLGKEALDARRRTARESEQRLATESRLLVREQELLQAQKMEAVGQLAGGLAHDFNNTLQVVLGTAEMLRPSLEGNPEDLELCDTLSQTARQSSAITRHLLMLSRRDVRVPEVFEVGGVLQELLKVLRRVVGSQIEVRFDGPETPCLVRADLMQFEQALTNLAINARDAMPDGGTLTVRLRPLRGGDLPPSLGADEGLDYVQIDVADTGAGMSEEVRSHIFDPFYTTKPAGTGTGLGLSMVRNMLQGHNSFVEVDSSLDVGTCFHLYLPAAPADAVAAASLRAPAPAAATGERVLVVEDSPPIRALLERALRGAGYVVQTARDGHDAWSLLDGGTFAPQLVVSDLVMPGVTGWQLLERVRRDTPEVPFLFCSGYSEEFVHQRVQLDARTRLLPKPFTTERLLREAREMLLPPSA